MIVARRLQQAANALGGGLFLIMFCVFIIQITARFGFNKPLPWTDEAAVILYVWVILWAAAAIVPEREHVVFDLVWNSVGYRARQAMRILGNLMRGGLSLRSEGPESVHLLVVGLPHVIVEVCDVAEEVGDGFVHLVEDRADLL